jgi:hypothetical protein
MDNEDFGEKPSDESLGNTTEQNQREPQYNNQNQNYNNYRGPKNRK